MPSGLLNGRGCYDSIKRCENESHLFLSIRNHGTPFIVEQHKTLVDPLVFHASAEISIEDAVKARFGAGAKPILRAMVKYIFLVTVFPFHFCFCRLPKLAAEKVFCPIISMLKKMCLIAKKPIVKVSEQICKPIIFFYKKVKAGFSKIFLAVKNSYLFVQKVTRRIKLQWHSVLIAPPKRLFRKVRGMLLELSQKCVRWKKLVKAWAKVLVSYGWNIARTAGFKAGHQR